MYGNMRFNKKRLKRQKNLLEKILLDENQEWQEDDRSN